jgi:CarD family transcriptional regulator
MKTSGRIAAPARTAKAASVAVARVHGDKPATAAAKPASKPATKAVAKPATKETLKPATKETLRPATKEAPKPAAKGAPKPATKEALKPVAKEAPKPAVKEAPTPSASEAPKPAPTPIATAEGKPAPQVKPLDKPAVAKAASTPPAIKVAAADPPTAMPRTDHPPASATPRPVAAPPRPVPAPGHSAPGHIDRRPGPVDRNPPRPPSKAEIFIEGDYVVYPTHGVGKVERIAIEEIAGHRLELIHITFEENRMTLRVPVSKARSAGLRKLATRKLFDEAMAVLKGRARIKRTMWSRRAQEYEAKINSGDPLSIAEVVRDLHRNAGQPDQSFSERQIYEAAMDRLAAELAALDKTDKPTAVVKLGDFLKTV